MSKASFQTSPSKALPTAITTEAPLPERAKPKSRKTPLRRFIEALASLKLTVALLAMSVVLVFCGTLAQLDHGIWAVVNSYFRSFFVLIPLYIFFPRHRSHLAFDCLSVPRRMGHRQPVARQPHRRPCHPLQEQSRHVPTVGFTFHAFTGWAFNRCSSGANSYCFTILQAQRHPAHPRWLDRFDDGRVGYGHLRH